MEIRNNSLLAEAGMNYSLFTIQYSLFIEIMNPEFKKE